MTTPATIVTALLAAGLLSLGYWNWQLYEANLSQATQIAELRDQAIAVENVRAEVMGQVEDVLGAAAGQVMASANAVEDRIASLESDVEDMQGIGYTPGLSASLADLDDRLGTAESDVANLWISRSHITDLQHRVQALESCVDAMNSDYGFTVYC